jgi:hypothetical protein
VSFNRDRIGHESGEWFERYVQDIFRFAGFKTQRDRMFFQSVKHEIDVWAESEFVTIAVECKDWSILMPNNIKKEFDAFITKVPRVGASKGVFAVNLPPRAIRQGYRDYLHENGLTLWDSSEVDKWHDDIERYDKLQYQKRLCDALGIVITVPTKAEKTFKILKTLGKAAYKSATVVAENMVEEERPRRRRRKSVRRITNR